MTYPETITLH